MIKQIERWSTEPLLDRPGGIPIYGEILNRGHCFWPRIASIDSAWPVHGGDPEPGFESIDEEALARYMVNALNAYPLMKRLVEATEWALSELYVPNQGSDPEYGLHHQEVRIALGECKKLMPEPDSAEA